MTEAAVRGGRVSWREWIPALSAIALIAGVSMTAGDLRANITENSRRIEQLEHDRREDAGTYREILQRLSRIEGKLDGARERSP